MSDDKRSRLWSRLRALDARFTCAPRWHAGWAADLAKIDAQRRDVRRKIKQYTGDGVGGSARPGTPGSVGSSPTPPTTQEAT